MRGETGGEPPVLSPTWPRAESDNQCNYSRALGQSQALINRPTVAALLLIGYGFLQGFLFRESVLDAPDRRHYERRDSQRDECCTNDHAYQGHASFSFHDDECADAPRQAAARLNEWSLDVEGKGARDQHPRDCSQTPRITRSENTLRITSGPPLHARSYSLVRWQTQTRCL